MSAKSERPTKRLRRLSSEYDDSEGAENWMPLKQRPGSRADGKDANSISRTRRSPDGSAQSEMPPGRSSAPSEETPTRPIRLTVKMPAARQRQTTSGSRRAGVTAARDSFEPGEILTGPRGTRSKNVIIDESDSDEDDEDASEEDTGGDSDQGGGGEEMELDEAPDSTAKPVGAKREGRPAVTVTSAKGKAKSVGRKDVNVDNNEDEDEEDDEEDDDEDEEDEEDEELSSAESDQNRAEEKGEGDAVPGGDEEVEDQVDDEEEEEEEEDTDDDGATPALDSRASTPDMRKLTKRQRSRWEDSMTGELLQLPSEPKAKKILSAEEHAMRRAEMARRRKNLSEKRNEEEKMDTINKLLKKQAPKQRRARPAEGTGDVTPNALDAEIEKPKATMIRWVSRQSGIRVGVPDEWLGTPAGKVFEIA